MITVRPGDTNGIYSHHNNPLSLSTRTPQAWLSPRSSGADVVIAGLQETQMGSGAVALSTAMEMLR